LSSSETFNDNTALTVKKVGFGSKKQYPLDPTRSNRFIILPDPNPQSPDHTTIKISQHNEDHNRHLGHDSRNVNS
jgi:hypothetical protein